MMLEVGAPLGWGPVGLTPQQLAGCVEAIRTAVEPLQVCGPLVKRDKEEKHNTRFFWLGAVEPLQARGAVGCGAAGLLCLGGACAGAGAASLLC